jgi:uncharacterized protein YdaU (DUF1376 family)
MSLSDNKHKTLGYMPFFFQRFAWSTRGWPAEAALAYLYLLCEQYTGGGLNANQDVLNSIAPGTSKHWDLIKPKFKMCEDGLIRNIRCEEIRINAICRDDKKSELARLAAMARWHPEQCGRNADAMPMQCGRIADALQNDAIDSDNDSQSDSKSEFTELKHTLNGSAVEPEFEKKKLAKSIPASEIERVWECFPRKVGKLKSLALIRKACDLVAIEHDLLDAGDAIEYMIEKVNLFADECRKKATEPQYIAHPQTWLNGGRYLDPVVTESH